MNFSERLIEAVTNKQSRLTVGLDPNFQLLPPSLLEGVNIGDRAMLARATTEFCIGIMDAVGDLIAAIKPQVAFFERLGPAGYASLEAVVKEARTRNLIIISDAKRGDIGSTAQAYADYHLGWSEGVDGEPSCLGADAMTINAYLGEDSLEPFIQYVRRGRGVFLLAKTSNPGSGDFQDKLLGDGKDRAPLYHSVAVLAERLTSQVSVGRFDYSSVGLVVGATYPQQAAALRAAFPRLLFLIPGVGAQGAKPADLRDCFDRDGLGAVVNSSRSIIFAYRDSANPSDWQGAARTAAMALRDEINSALRGK
jgi:orotidine-5'-phosphate decarboxylase